MRLAAALSAVGTTAATIMLAVPARADVDTDFANQLHTYGIYGQRDYNAWLAKITCERLDDGLDSNAEKSAVFLSPNLLRGSTTEQTWCSSSPRRSTPTAPTGTCGPDVGGGNEPMR